MQSTHLLELDREQLTAIATKIPGGLPNIATICPLAPLQEGMLFHHLHNPAVDGYVLSSLFELRSRESAGELVDAIKKVIDRHDALRTAILWEDLPHPVLVVQRQAALTVEHLDLRSKCTSEAERARLMRPSAHRFDLRTAPLLHLTIAFDSSATGPCFAILYVHHIICDHQSLRLLDTEALAIVNGNEHQLPQAASIIDSVAYAPDKTTNAQSNGYFKRKLQDFTDPTVLFGVRGAHIAGREIHEVRERLGVSLAGAVRIQSRRVGVSAARTFHAAWALVVATASGRDEAVFGTVLLTDRHHRRADERRMLGMSVNTLPIRIRLQDTTARDLLLQADSEIKALTRHANASLIHAQRCSGVPNKAELFTSIFNFRHSTVDLAPAGSESGATRVVTHGEAWSNYPVAITIDDLGDDFEMIVQVDQRIDARRVLSYLRCALQTLSEALQSAPMRPAIELSALPDAERARLLTSFNDTDAPYPSHAALHDLFLEHVRRAPQATAIKSAEATLSYAQLNERANQLARHILSLGPLVGTYVPIEMSRSPLQIIAALAVLKGGGAYIPVDPDLPIDRRRFILADCRATCVISDRARPSDLGNDSLHWIDIVATAEAIASYPTTDLILVVAPVASAYVMYTSGSTGTPKGVDVSHRAVNRLAINNGIVEITPEDCLLNHSNPSFDASTFEVWCALLNGASVAVLDQENALDIERFRATLRRQRVSIMYLSVGLFNQFADRLGSVLSQLRCVIVGGDTLDPTTIRRVLSKSAPARLLNAYGPTECTTFTTTFEIAGLEASATSIPIGRAMSNARVYVLDNFLRIVPIGVAGELWIAGAGVAHGYLSRPELTAQRFIPNPFDANLPRMYRSGDLVMWRADGTLEFLGRNDQQVKVRGFRVELGEIEARLMQHENIDNAAVAVRPDGVGEKAIVAYVVPKQNRNVPTLDELREHVKESLPDYMAPSAFVVLDRLPLSSTGKVDRRALPAPDRQSYATRQHVAPEGDVEEILCGIWQALLNIERVGATDNFFELGGHSLIAVQMMARLARVGLVVEVRRIFDSPTLRELARAITPSAEQPVIAPSLIPAGCKELAPAMIPLVDLEEQHLRRIESAVSGGAENIQDIYPLTALQEGILFYHTMMNGHDDVYVFPTLLKIDSADHCEAFLNALQLAVQRHEVLRTLVLWHGLSKPVQVVCRVTRFSAERVHLDPERDARSQALQWLEPQQREIDLSKAPLVRVRVAQDPLSDDHYVLVLVHHIILDGQSLWSLLVELLQLSADPQATLQSTKPFRNHVGMALAQARRGDSEAFFRTKLSTLSETTAPFDLLDVHQLGSSQLRDSRRTLCPEFTARIKRQARRSSVSAATLFHAAWALVVAKITGRDDVIFGTVFLGRLHASLAAHATLGPCINTLPIRLNLLDSTPKELIIRTQKELMELIPHEQTALSVAQKCSGIAASAPLFTTLLNFRHGMPSFALYEGFEFMGTRGATNFPITLSIDDVEPAFVMTAQVDQRLEPGRILGYMAEAVESLVAALECSSEVAATDLQIVPDDERQDVIEHFNKSGVIPVRDTTVHQLFEEQASRTPDTVAAIYSTEQLTYRELDRRADTLARVLRDQGIRSGSLVALFLNRGPDVVVGLLAVLKAGGAYLPLDPNYPAARLNHMLADASPAVILTQRSLVTSLPQTCAIRILTDEIAWQVAGPDADGTGSQVHPNDLVYVIFTSGSTGRPKGTAMQHSAMVNLIEWHRANLNAAGARVAQFAALSFDVAFQEILTTVCTGGSLLLMEDWVRKDAHALMEWLRDERVSTLFIPPLMLQTLAEYCNVTGLVPQDLIEIITAGEALKITPEVAKLFKSLPRCRLHNHYGPTETHVVTAQTMAADPETWPALPSIGRPVANARIYILDARLDPAPIGAAGDIYIGGATLARGYLNRPELTDEKFVRDPFVPDANGRMYKTGDRGKWRPDGTIEFLGRNDNQVKIRGFRIELGEIESHLLQHPNVSSAAVLALDRQGGERSLVAYVTPKGRQPSADQLSTHLRRQLPEHMIPPHFVHLESMPLTPNGKLDRRALPAPEIATDVLEEFEPPRGHTEQSLAEMWGRLLRVSNPDRRANFFRLGGNSITSLRLAVQVAASLAVDLPTSAIMQHPTLQDLARKIDEIREVRSSKHAPGPTDLEEGVIV